MKIVIKVVESSEHKVVYGYLEVENATVDEVQAQICKIKNCKEFQNEFPDWCITDVFEKFPSSWKWNFISDNGYTVEI